MDVWHKETTPGTTGSRCTIRDGSGLFVAECIASDASRIVEAPAMVEALRDASEELQAWRGKFHPSEWPDKPVVHTAIRDKIRAILSRIDGAGDALPDAPVPAPTADLQNAARALLDAFGGNVPDWLAGEAQALESALNGVPAPTGEAPSMADLLDFVQTAARGNTDADDLQAWAMSLLAIPTA